MAKSGIVKLIEHLFSNKKKLQPEKSEPEEIDLFEIALEKYKTGQPFRADLEKVYREQLRGYLQMGKGGALIKKVQVSGGGCDACKKLDGQIFTVEDAYRNMILPCKDCDYKIRKKDRPGWCKCIYLPVMEWEQ